MKFCLAFLVAVGSLFQSGDTQTVSSGGGKLVNAQFNSNRQGCTTLASRTGKTNHERNRVTTDPESERTNGIETPSQLDSITIQAADAAVVRMDDQARIALQDTVSKFMKGYDVPDRDIKGALKAAKAGSIWDSTGSYLRHPAPNEILGLVISDLLSDRESFAHDIIDSLVVEGIFMIPTQNGI